MVSSDVRITGAVARQTGLRAIQIETNGLASVHWCWVLLALIVILGRIFGFKTCMFNLIVQKFKKRHLLRDCEEA